MSQYSSPESPNPRGFSEEHPEKKKSKGSSPPKLKPKPKALQHIYTKLPNISIDEIDEESEDVPLDENAILYNRYDGSIHASDITEASYTYAEQRLTHGPRSSFIRGVAYERSQVQEATERLSRISTPADPEAPLQATAAQRSAEIDRKWRNTRREANDQRKQSDTSWPLDNTASAPVPSADTLIQDDDGSSKPSGKWRCCKCKRGHEVYTFAQGQHPVSAVSCDCTHRSCSKCTLEGLVKRYAPMSEPEVVPLSEDRTNAIRFGVFCDGCGISWRAEEVKDQGKDKTTMKSTLQRISGIPRRLTKRGHGPHPLERVRASQSMNNLLPPPRKDASTAVLKGASKSTLDLRALSNEMEKEHGEQAKLVTVKFVGIQCTCGMITDDTTSLCFQIVDPPKDFHTTQFAKQMAERNVAGFGSTPEDKAKGHGTPKLTLKNGVRHPNPLMSNPV
jgi:hypothetical protein